MLIDILQETNYKVSETVFIGDSIHDIQMAKVLDMTSIAVSYGAVSREVALLRKILLIMSIRQRN